MRATLSVLTIEFRVIGFILSLIRVTCIESDHFFQKIYSSLCQFVSCFQGDFLTMFWKFLVKILLFCLILKKTDCNWSTEISSQKDRKTHSFENRAQHYYTTPIESICKYTVYQLSCPGFSNVFFLRKIDPLYRKGPAGGFGRKYCSGFIGTLCSRSSGHWILFINRL